ncbi:hypothetical protein STENM327S_08792 [Streptomyces tendae]
MSTKRLGVTAVTGTAAEDVLLELLNTTPVTRGSVADALGTPAEGRAWVRGHGGAGSDEEVAFLVAARDALQDVVRGGGAPVPGPVPQREQRAVLRGRQAGWTSGSPRRAA